METIWKAEIPAFNSLESNIETDVCIIGGGIAGLWCAYHSIQNGQKVCILESKTIGSGVTAGSSAIFSYAEEDIYNTIIKKHSISVARKYLDDIVQSIDQIVKIAKANLHPIFLCAP